MPDSSDGPTVLRILLGSHLRRLRESRGITARQAAGKIRASESKISRIELGRNAIREIDVLDLLTLYGVDAREREQLLTLAEQSNRPGWWHRYNDILPDWFQAYVGMEEAARSIRVYEAQFIPGLLQTEEYATAVISLGDFPLEQAERLVVLRKERQRRFREGKLKLWVILDEAALRRPVAGTAVQLDQLRYLRKACANPTLTLQVIPYGAGGHAVADRVQHPAVRRARPARRRLRREPDQRALPRQAGRRGPLPARHGAPFHRRVRARRDPANPGRDHPAAGGRE